MFSGEKRLLVVTWSMQCTSALAVHLDLELQTHADIAAVVVSIVLLT